MIIGYIHENSDVINEYVSVAQSFYRHGKLLYICVNRVLYNRRSIEEIDHKNYAFRTISSYRITTKFKNGYCMNTDLVPRNYYLDNIHAMNPHNAQVIQ